MGIWMAGPIPRPQHVRGFSLATTLQPQYYTFRMGAYEVVGWVAPDVPRNAEFVDIVLHVAGQARILLKVESNWVRDLVLTRPTRPKKCFFCSFNVASRVKCSCRRTRLRVCLFSSLATTAVRVGRTGQRPWSSKDLH